MPALRRPFGVAPEWTMADGSTVRQVSGEKAYRCPGCQQVVRALVTHLVVVEDEDVASRRHWHTECWRRELRRRGHRV